MLTFVGNGKHFILEPFPIKLQTCFNVMVGVYNNGDTDFKVASYYIEQFLMHQSVRSLEKDAYLDGLLKVFFVLISFYLINNKDEAISIFKMMTPQMWMLTI